MTAVRIDFTKIRIRIDGIEIGINQQQTVVGTIFDGRQYDFVLQISHDVHNVELTKILIPRTQHRLIFFDIDKEFACK